jgi:hypothetical protein
MNVPLFSRDIDLDRIYINSSSSLYRHITASKEKLYSEIFSIQADTGVIFADWTDTGKLLYIKEAGSLNILYEYSRESGKKRELYRFRGNVTSAMLSPAGHLLAVKILFYSSARPVSQNIYINTSTGSVKKENSRAMFRDMTFYPGSDSILKNREDGIYRFSPFSGSSERIIQERIYKDMADYGQIITAHLSPDKTKKVILSGGGGSYKARLFTDSGAFNISGVSSNLDLLWIDNRRFAFRSGTAGNYSVKLYNADSGKAQTLLNGTLNPDIHYSHEAKILTFLDNQVINIFYADNGRKIHTGLEGEVVYFSPDSSRFSSIYSGRLWITNVNMLLRRGLEIRRRARETAALYQEALKSREIHENSYSAEYIKLKIKLYNDIASGKK